MQELIPIQSEQIDMNGTMTTVQIAELTQKKHFHVVRDVKTLIEQGAVNQSRCGLVNYRDKKGEDRPMYELNFESTMVLVTGYDAVKRAAVISRWMSLERGESSPSVKSSRKEELELELLVVQTTADMLRLSDSAKLNMMHILCDHNKIPSLALPQYTEKVRSTSSVTHLLAKNGCLLKRGAFIKLLIAAGYLEKKERLTSRGKTEL